MTALDANVRLSTSREIKREESLQRTTHRPMLVAGDTLATDPSMTKRAFMRKAKNAVVKEDSDKRERHAKSLASQGQVFRCSEDQTDTIWSKSVSKLPPELLKFSLNAVQDTLPHNANLSIWRKAESLSSSCKLCGERQTLIHVLNCCPRALRLRRYNERYDAVLDVISTFMADLMPEDCQLITNQPRFHPYVFPNTLLELLRDQT